MLRIPRLPWDEFFMLHAHLAATRSTCDRGPGLLLDPGRRGVGAIVVRENRIVAGGYNGSPPGEPHCDELECPTCDAVFEGVAREGLGRGSECPCCASDDLVGGHLMSDGHCVRTLHAEENALLQCALDGVSPARSTVFTTASPCYDCAKRLVRVGVRRVCFADLYESRHGLSGEAVAILRRAGVAVELVDVRRVVRGSTFTF